VSRDLGWPAKMLDAARLTLETHGDVVNAAHARYLAVRRLLLVGRLDEAERALADLDPGLLPPALRTAHELVVAGIAIRRLDTTVARAALARAADAARETPIAALTGEVESASLALDTPAARLISRGKERLLRLDEVRACLASKALVVDACRNAVRDAPRVVSLASRPVLFALARALGEAWPGDVSRDTLVERAFGAKRADESHRARLRVEIGRLRTMLRAVAGVKATKQGFVLEPRRAREVVVLAQPAEMDDEHAAVLAFLADGESWSSSALALALGASQRTVQRALDSLAGAGKVQWLGRGRARRWMTPAVGGFTTVVDHLRGAEAKFGGLACSCHPNCGSSVFIVANRRNGTWAPVTQFFDVQAFLDDLAVIADSARGRTLSIVQIALAMLRYFDDALESVQSIETDGERITRVRVQRNPAKLARIASQLQVMLFTPL